MIKEHPERALVVLAMFALGVFIAGNNMPTYLVQCITNGDTTGTGRFPMRVTLAETMLNNPIRMIFGFGTRVVKYYTGTGLVSHNTYLDLLFNEGLVSFIPLVIYRYDSN